jgi:hypothetical protein
VGPATNGDLKTKLGGKSDGVHDVGHTAAFGNQRWPLVDEPIMNLSCQIVALVRWLEELPLEGGAEIGGSAGDRCDGRHDTVSSVNLPILSPGLARSKSEEFS